MLGAKKRLFGLKICLFLELLKTVGRCEDKIFFWFIKQAIFES